MKICSKSARIEKAADFDRDGRVHAGGDQAFRRYGTYAANGLPISGVGCIGGLGRPIS